MIRVKKADEWSYEDVCMAKRPLLEKELKKVAAFTSDDWLIDNPKTLVIDGCKQWTAREIYDVLREADVTLATEEELLATRA